MLVKNCIKKTKIKSITSIYQRANIDTEDNRILINRIEYFQEQFRGDISVITLKT